MGTIQLVLIILGTHNNEFIEDVLKEAKQDLKRLGRELIKETWEAMSMMKNEGLDTKGNKHKKILQQSLLAAAYNI